MQLYVSSVTLFFLLRSWPPSELSLEPSTAPCNSPPDRAVIRLLPGPRPGGSEKERD